MLMAAGLGTRLRPFTEHYPKALVPVMGIPVAQFAMDALVEVGVEQVTYNFHHHPELTQKGFESLERGSARLVSSDESALLLGSAGGLKKALPTFEDQPFYWLNADIISNLDLRALAETHSRLVASAGVKMTLAVLPQAPLSGSYREIILDSATGLVRGFSSGLMVGRPFFASAAILEPAAFANVPAGVPAEFVPTVLEPWVKAGKVGFHLSKGYWKDIGTPELWLDAHLSLIKKLETGQLPMVWRKRIEAINERLGNQVWAAKEKNHFTNRTLAQNWSGPCYFSGSRFVEELGPRAVLYGAALHKSQEPQGVDLRDGIGFGAKWAQCVDKYTGISPCISI